MFFKKNLSKEQASEKIKHYCAYQERCHSEVKDKLYSYGLRRPEVEEIIAETIESNYLNEERFAIQFAGGKFRMKHWGRKKIQYELQQKGVNPRNIKIALKDIEEEKYIATLKNLAEKKWKSISDEHYLARQAKTTAYLLQKGYESSLINEVISEIRASGNKN